jgi:predicted nucleotidyltransferase
MIHSQLSPPHRLAIDRFVAACQADDRVVAAVLGGSYASGQADAFSDLDLAVITTDATFDDFCSAREGFMRVLGEPLFLESFNSPITLFAIFDDGTELELSIGRESQFDGILIGPYAVLVDKRGILSGAVFTGTRPTEAEQIETLRRLVYWFWHDVSHCVAAVGRGQLWWALGQLEVLRRVCVELARLQMDFAEAPSGYDKVNQAVPVDVLAPLESTLCALQREPMVQALRDIVRFYRRLAPDLATAHGLVYPAALDRIISGHLDDLARSVRAW